MLDTRANIDSKVAEHRVFALEVLDNLLTAEVKEIVGGFLICKVETLEEALELAKGCPIHAYGGTVEVRELMKLDF